MRNEYSIFLIALIAVAFTFKAVSCKSDNGDKADNSISLQTEFDANFCQGQLSKLINAPDTLIFHINLSGCMNKRFDIISFFKKQDTIYLFPKIIEIWDIEKTISGYKTRYFKINDSLNFENLLINICNFESEKIDTDENRILLSLSVKNKWYKKYYCSRDNPYFVELKNYYLAIMNSFYPEMVEFQNMGELEIIEGELEIIENIIITE
jgi:hypothetical protein